MQLIIKTLAGLEEVLAEELTALGADAVEIGKRVVTCAGTNALLYRANLELRTALRVLVPITDFTVRNEEDLYRAVGRVEWSNYLRVDQTLAIDVVTTSARLNHSHFLALKTKDAIVDYFRALKGRRPNVDTQSPDLRLHLHIGSRGECTLSRDSSGEGLHRRGYRSRGGMAPINEVLAAGLLRLAGFDGSTAFVDPLCGSGTLLIEAALMAQDRAPGLDRSFGFERWADFDADLFKDLKNKAKRRVQRVRYPIIGSDRDGRILTIAQENLARLQLLDQVRLVKKPFQTFIPPKPPGVLVTNPPYELRVQTGDIEALYRAFGDVLKQQYAGYTAWVLSANLEALKKVGLRPSRKIHLQNGPLEARFYRYDLYEGSRRKDHPE